MVDSETGLYYLMSRYYDPSIGQFISEDSYRGDGEAFWHLYAYCEGDPVNKVDKMGTFGSWIANTKKLNEYGTNGVGGASSFNHCKNNVGSSANCLGFALGINKFITPHSDVISNLYSVDSWYYALKIKANSNKRWVRKLSSQYSKIFPNEYRCALRCITKPKTRTGAYTNVNDATYDAHYMRQLSNGYWGDKHGTGTFYHSNHWNPNNLSEWLKGTSDRYDSRTIYFAVCKWRYAK